MRVIYLVSAVWAAVHPPLMLLLLIRLVRLDDLKIVIVAGFSVLQTIVFMFVNSINSQIADIELC